jgi:hypothetical protein
MSRTWHVIGPAPTAVERAKALARLEGFVVVAVERVEFAGDGPVWKVTLAVTRP